MLSGPGGGLLERNKDIKALEKNILESGSISFGLYILKEKLKKAIPFYIYFSGEEIPCFFSQCLGGLCSAGYGQISSRLSLFLRLPPMILTTTAAPFLPEASRFGRQRRRRHFDSAKGAIIQVYPQALAHLAPSPSFWKPLFFNGPRRP